MDKRQKCFIIIILIIFVFLILIATILLINKNQEFNELVDDIKNNLYNTYIVKIEYSDSTDENGEVINGKIVFITNKDVVEDLVDVFKDATMDNYNATEENDDIGYTLEFLDKDNEVILKINNQTLTYQEKNLKITYDHDKLSDLIKSVE